MADKQTQALKRLTKKLNALRKTLRADERSLLDRIVLGEAGAAEVQAHRVRAKAAKTVVEVEAHKLATHLAPAVRSMIDFDGAKNDYVVTFEGPEVEGHLLKEAVATQVLPKVIEKNAY
jgi:transposase